MTGRLGLFQVRNKDELRVVLERREIRKYPKMDPAELGADWIWRETERCMKDDPCVSSSQGCERTLTLAGCGGHPSENVFGHLDVYMMMSLTLDLLNLNCLPRIMGVVWKLT